MRRDAILRPQRGAVARPLAIGIGSRDLEAFRDKEKGLQRKSLKAVGAIAVLALFAFVLWVLSRQLRGINYQEVVAALGETPRERVLIATGLVVLSYTALTLYDFLGFRYAGHPLAYRVMALPAFICYAMSNNIGMSILGGVAFRYRFYSAMGLSKFAIAKIVVFCSLTFWLGLLAMSGVVFLWEPFPQIAGLPFAGGSVLSLGLSLLVIVGGYMLACWWRGGAKLTIRGWTLTLPTWGMALCQIAVASLDWLCASSVLYALMPESMGLSYGHVVALYMVATTVGLISNVPGGLGVIETIFVMALSPQVPPQAVLGAVLAFRALYYFLPLIVAVLLFGVAEITPLVRHLGRFGPHSKPRDSTVER